MSPLRVEASPDGSRAVAARAIRAGETLCRIEGEVCATPSRYTLQVGPGRHIAAPEAAAWRYLDHGCAPNAALVGEALVARRAIEAGEPVTFDYETTEAELAEPFVCRCGAESCRGVIRGFRHAAPAADAAA